MGCTQSTIENEESVTRCRARKLYMKEAVRARNAFASAHSTCAINIKNTGAAISDFAHAEFPSQVIHSSQVPLSPIGGSSSPAGPSAVPTTIPRNTLPPPPPPLPNLGSPTLLRAASMPHIKIQKSIKAEGSAIVEGDEEDGINDQEKLVRRSRRGGGSERGVVELPPPTREQQGRRDAEVPRSTPVPPDHNSAYEYFFPPVESMPGTTLAEPSAAVSNSSITDKEYMMKKVAETTSNKSIEEVIDVVEEDDVEDEDEDEDEEEDVVIVPETKKAEKAVEVPAQVQFIPVIENKEQPKKPVKGVSLVHLFEEIDDHFLKASQSAYDVTKMLEATRLHYHSNFADNRGHIDHSARVMRVITWNRSFRGFLNIDDGKDEKDDFDSEENETHATVLDKLLAWEKKLYDEVKVGEQMKYDYQKKVELLNKKKKRGAKPESLEKLKAAVSHLHTRYIVDMQSMDSTVAEINRLRDEQLYPKLAQLVKVMELMWESMRMHHEAQFKIAIQLRILGIALTPIETTDHHHERTFQLAVAADDWHAEFCKLIDNQRSYIKALNNWLKLNLIPIESNLKEKVSSPPRIAKPRIQELVEAWDAFMDSLQDDGARSAIKNFASVIHSIYQYQDEEMKMKETCEETKRELFRRTRQFEDWYNKFIQQRTPEELDPDNAEDNPHTAAIAERQGTIEDLKKRLQEEEEAHRKMSLQVREKSLSSLKTRLPELFRAMSDVAKSFSDVYSKLSSVSYPQRRD